MSSVANRGLHGLCLVLVVLAARPGVLGAQADPARTSVWLGAGATLVGAMVLDQALRDGLAAEPGDVHPLSVLGNHMGNGRKMVASVTAAHLAGRALGERELVHFAENTMVALLAAGAVNGLLKFSIGRVRPNPDNDTDRFRPFTLDDRWQSFPSGHVVVAFSLATAIAEQTDRSWIGGLSYGAAGLVAWSRIHEDRHWASDVIGGALIGTTAAGYALRARSGKAEWSNVRAIRRVQAAIAEAELTMTPFGVFVYIPTP